MFFPVSLSIFGDISTDASVLSSIAIILGAVFVVIQLRDDKKLSKRQSGRQIPPRSRHASQQSSSSKITILQPSIL